MNMKQLKSACKALRCTVTYNRDDDEYRVNVWGGNEASAYYTNDALDALGTARDMYAHKLVVTMERTRVIEDRREYEIEDLQKMYLLDTETATVLYRKIQTIFGAKT